MGVCGKTFSTVDEIVSKLHFFVSYKCFLLHCRFCFTKCLFWHCDFLNFLACRVSGTLVYTGSSHHETFMEYVGLVIFGHAQ